MPKSSTSVRLPDDLIEALDRHTKALGITRSQLIVRALKKAVAESSEWSPRFLKATRSPCEELDTAVDELMSAITSRRSRNKAPDL